MNIFEQASHMKLRFQSTLGLLTTEDLWDLPLKSRNKISLNKIAKGISRSLKTSSEEDFVDDISTGNKNLELRMDIVKHIIKARKDANEAKTNKMVTEQKRAKIDSILEEMEDDVLKGTSKEELLKMREAL